MVGPSQGNTKGSKSWLTICRVAMRTLSHVAPTSRRLVHKFWKNVRVAQHQAATPPSLSRGIHSTAVKMNEKLFYLLQNLALYLRCRRIRHQ